jgi:Uma2 family endonuclease
LTRRRFTSADVQRMAEIGLIDPDERIELIHGEIIDMGKEGPPHWNARAELINWVLRRLPADTKLAPDGPLRLAADEEPEPDFYLFPAAMNVNDVRGPDVLLAVEIADSSLVKDRDIKAPLYAAHGVRAYWIVVLETRETLVHRLAGQAYGAPEACAFAAPLQVPGIAEPLLLDRIL